MVTIRTPAEVATAALAEERATMRAYRMAVRSVLMNRPVTDSVPLATAVPGAGHLLAGIDAYVSALPAYDAFKEAWPNVTIFERENPDIDAIFVTALGLSAEWVDQMFRDAMVIEWP